jgi:hypothetical protein
MVDGTLARNGQLPCSGIQYPADIVSTDTLQHKLIGRGRQYAYGGEEQKQTESYGPETNFFHSSTSYMFGHCFKDGVGDNPPVSIIPHLSTKSKRRTADFSVCAL